MAAAPLDAWTNFFIAEAGAAAALLGLLFVAISINLARILNYPHLPGRAAESLAMLVGALILCSAGLVPGQPEGWLGAEYLVCGLGMWLCPTVNRVRTRTRFHPDHMWKLVLPIVIGQAATLPIALAGVAILAGHWGALYVVPPALMLCFIAAVWNAWVLLVEIMR
ncbi:MAG TPA: hypothetical protein VLV50_05230 [Stellaceae bacterium]|nr:hypothetical protein [Stellaceae bacterium]